MGSRLRLDLTAVGFEVGPSLGPIVPVIVGEPERALSLAGALRGLGLLVPAIRPPTVPEGTARLRISLAAAHTDDDVAALVNAMKGLA
jgi:8-amino-7-oxononanoate synthase